MVDYSLLIDGLIGILLGQLIIMLLQPSAVSLKLLEPLHRLRKPMIFSHGMNLKVLSRDSEGYFNT